MLLLIGRELRHSTKGATKTGLQYYKFNTVTIGHASSTDHSQYYAVRATKQNLILHIIVLG